MLRAIALSVVLALAAGPSASLLCKAWCDPHVAAENGCHGQGAGEAASVASDDSCQDSVQESTVFLKEDARRTASEDSAPAVATARFQRAPSTSDSRPIWRRGRAPSDPPRPLDTPLRI